MKKFLYTMLALILIALAAFSIMLWNIVITLGHFLHAVLAIGFWVVFIRWMEVSIK
jgi:hypothetical protein